MMDVIDFLDVARSLFIEHVLCRLRGRYFVVIEYLGMPYKSYGDPYVIVLRQSLNTKPLILAASYATLASSCSLLPSSTCNKQYSCIYLTSNKNKFIFCFSKIC